MTIIKKFKKLPNVKTKTIVRFLNLIISFTLAIPFAQKFYEIGLSDALWIGLFTFVGAPTLYETFKTQKIINYTPTSTSDSITISKKNKIEIK